MTKNKSKKTLPHSQDAEKHKFPLFLSPVKAGFPSIADDHIDQELDLNTFLIKHPAATFFVRVSGSSMINAGIFSGDLLVVDRSLDWHENSIAIVIINGEFTVKRIKKIKENLYLSPENKKFKPIKITPDKQCEIWGIVTYIIHKAR
jgi:DNA polymerase V